jgi:glyoxylase-like metal-dependent hydrolase (beta-lactamase superfamily II)
MEPTLIELKQNRAGYDPFIASWVCRGDSNIVVDVGPANSVRTLTEALNAMGMDRVDLVLITHIHIDHAGGLADFLKQFPMAKVVCHSIGVKHLVDPSKLWAGSLKVLGELAEFYGPIKPVKEEALIAHTQAEIEGLRVMETPGHAPHHLSFSYQGNLFVGEASGTFHDMGDLEYVRPATPPKFFMEECLSSVDQLLGIEDQPIYYVHFGKAKSSHHQLKRYRDQLIRWAEIIKQEMAAYPEDLVNKCMESLLEKDPELKAFYHMDPDMRERERYFLTNSIHGYIEYLQSRQ